MRPMQPKIFTQGEILLVDDDPDLLQLITLRLISAGYNVTTATGGEEALRKLAARRPDLVITDLRMEGMDGLDLFDRIRRDAPSLPVLLLTAHGTVPDAVAATQRGVFAFLTKPFDSHQLLVEVERARRLSGDVRDDTSEPWRAQIITRSPIMEEILRRARLVAASDASVLLRGASGVGKELLAHAIHLASPRSGEAFIAVNCGAIPEQLLESELFGHARGAFTGATQDHKGLFQAADGGTLFLDEIGDMPLMLQVKLLRVLQERQVRPVGVTTDIPVNVRLICATHRNLEQLVKEGTFREDLYYRINVVALSIPTLAERREDIPLLASHFLQQLARRYGKPVARLAPEALECMLNASWPGNIRQLVNALERAVALSLSSVIPLALLQETMQEEDVGILPLDEARRHFEHDYLVRLLRMTRGNVAQSARLAQRNRTDFYKLLQRHELSPTQFKASEETPEQSG
jgi:two-component system response regulator GlrR